MGGFRHPIFSSYHFSVLDAGSGALIMLDIKPDRDNSFSKGLERALLLYIQVTGSLCRYHRQELLCSNPP